MVFPYGAQDTGDWSNGMIGVSKTFGGSSILSSPVWKKSENLFQKQIFRLFCLYEIKGAVKVWRKKSWFKKILKNFHDLSI